MVAHGRYASFKGRSSLRTWLYGIALRVALNFGRRRARRRESFEAAPEQKEEAPAQPERTQQRETLRLIEQVLARMDADKREVFALYELEGMTMAEVASALGMPENTVLYRLYAARDEIRGTLYKHEQGVRVRGPTKLRRIGP